MENHSDTIYVSKKNGVRPARFSCLIQKQNTAHKDVSNTFQGGTNNEN